MPDFHERWRDRNQTRTFSANDSRAILDFHYAHVTRPEFVYRHRWQPGDVVIGGNRSLMRCAVADYGDATRYMERTTVIGERRE